MATDTEDVKTLRRLLEEKTAVRSSAELRAHIGGSLAQCSNLWHGHDPIGARLILRILTAFPQLTVQELAQVREAAKALTPAPAQKCSCDHAAAGDLVPPVVSIAQEA